MSVKRGVFAHTTPPGGVRGASDYVRVSLICYPHGAPEYSYHYNRSGVELFLEPGPAEGLGFWSLGGRGLSQVAYGD